MKREVSGFPGSPDLVQGCRRLLGTQDFVASVESLRPHFSHHFRSEGDWLWIFPKIKSPSDVSSNPDITVKAHLGGSSTNPFLLPRVDPYLGEELQDAGGPEEPGGSSKKKKRRTAPPVPLNPVERAHFLKFGCVFFEPVYGPPPRPPSTTSRAARAVPSAGASAHFPAPSSTSRAGTRPGASPTVEGPPAIPGPPAEGFVPIIPEAGSPLLGPRFFTEFAVCDFEGVRWEGTKGFFGRVAFFFYLWGIDFARIQVFERLAPEADPPPPSPASASAASLPSEGGGDEAAGGPVARWCPLCRPTGHFVSVPIERIRAAVQAIPRSSPVLELFGPDSKSTIWINSFITWRG